MEILFVLELLEQGEKNCEHSGLYVRQWSVTLWPDTVVYDTVTYDTVVYDIVTYDIVVYGHFQLQQWNKAEHATTRTKQQ